LAETDPQANKARRLRQKARNLAEAGKINEAIGCQRALANLTPNDFETIMQLGFMHQAASEIDNAASAFHQAVGLSPRAPEAHEALAEMYLEAARYDDAIIESKLWLKLRPHSIAARDIISTAYLQKGEISKALEAANEMVRLSPVDALGYYKRAILHQYQGNWSGALEQFTMAAQIAVPNSQEHQEALSAIEALDQYQIRAIMTLACEDGLFRILLRRDSDEAIRERGFHLSPMGIAFVQHMLPDISAGLYVFPESEAINAFSYRPLRYN
jgi:tetratricopeptide (TPR) repeat protein